jgi:hypothetical protein
LDDVLDEARPLEEQLNEPAIDDVETLADLGQV